MFDLDRWIEIWVTITRNKTRSLLTCFGCISRLTDLPQILCSSFLTELPNHIKDSIKDEPGICVTGM